MGFYKSMFPMLVTLLMALMAEFTEANMNSIALDASLAPFRMHSAVSLKQGILNEETCFVDVPNATSFKSVPSKAIREYKSTDPALFKMTGLAPAQKSSRVSYISDE